MLLSGVFPFPLSHQRQRILSSGLEEVALLIATGSWAAEGFSYLVTVAPGGYKGRGCPNRHWPGRQGAGEPSTKGAWVRITSCPTYILHSAQHLGRRLSFLPVLPLDYSLHFLVLMLSLHALLPLGSAPSPGLCLQTYTWIFSAPPVLYLLVPGTQAHHFCLMERNQYE